MEVKAGDVLITKAGPRERVGVVVYVDEAPPRLMISGKMIGLRPKKNLVDNRVFAAVLSTDKSQRFLDSRTTGMADSQLNFTNELLLNTEVEVPQIEQQTKISALIKEIDNQISLTEALIHKYQQIKAGLMHDLFTRGLTADGKLRPPREQAPELYQETSIGWIPREWGLGVVQDHGTVKFGRQRSPNQHSGKWTTPYLRVANVFDGFIDYSDVLEMDFTPTEKETFYLKFGDILLNEGQSLELVGRNAVYLGDDDKYCIQNTLVRFRCYKNHDPFFYGFLLKWWFDIGLFMQISKQTTSVAHLGADRFARLPCPMVDYDEQLAIAEMLSMIQKRIDTENENMLKNKQLKAGLMHDLLTGKVQVKIDPEETIYGS